MLAYVLGGLRPATGADAADAWVGLSAHLRPRRRSRARCTSCGPPKPASSGSSAPVDGRRTGAARRDRHGPAAGPLGGRRTSPRGPGCAAQDAAKAVLQAVHQGVLCSYERAGGRGRRAGTTLLTPARDPRGAALLDDVRSAAAALRDRARPPSAGPNSGRSRRPRRAQPAGWAARHRSRSRRTTSCPPLTVATRRWQRPLADLGADGGAVVGVRLAARRTGDDDRRVRASASVPGRPFRWPSTPTSLVEEVSRRAP